MICGRPIATSFPDLRVREPVEYEYKDRLPHLLLSMLNVKSWSQEIVHLVIVAARKKSFFS
jgi:hypothetical protein